MAEITLSDYTGYIFAEMVRAREIADRYSRDLATLYAADEVMRHFSVPRFKVPKMQLTIPVLISGARFRQVVAFHMEPHEFVAFIQLRVRHVARWLAGMTLPRARGAAEDELRSMASGLYDRLVANPSPPVTEDTVADGWRAIFDRVLDIYNLHDQYRAADPEGVHYAETLEVVQRKVEQATVIESTRIENLLINPETNVVKNGSSESSVFVVGAEIVEDGFFLREVTDSETGQTHRIVEFE